MKYIFTLIFIFTYCKGQDYTMAFPYRDTPPIHHKKHNYQFAKKLGCCWQFKLFGNTFVYLPCHHECKFEDNKTKTKTLNDIELFTYSCGEYKSKDKISNKDKIELDAMNSWIIFASPNHIWRHKYYKIKKEYNPFEIKRKKGNPFETK